MNLTENIKEGLKSVKANLLRSILTALIVAVGITSLVGILTAIDSIQYSINDSLADLGVNTFDIYSKRNRGGRRGGRSERVYPPLKYREVQRFVDVYDYPATVSLSTRLSQTAEVKRLSEKTNPNVWVIGANDEYVALEGLNIDKGRNFSRIEIQYGTNVAVVGPDLVDALFKDKSDPLDAEISVLNNKFKVIGVLEEKGSLDGGGGTDNAVIIPIIKANSMAGNRVLSYTLSIGITNPVEMEYAMGEATGIMRSVRHDKPGEENSFELAKSETLAQQMEEITGVLRIGGFGVGFVTLLGAAIALMNIMMVSVTERTREVGVRKALGATPLRIRQQFIIEAIVVCILGGALGIVLGIGIGNTISLAIGVGGFVVPWLWIIVAVVVCVAVGLLSGYYPAYKASRLDPIESLRFE